MTSKDLFNLLCSAYETGISACECGDGRPFDTATFIDLIRGQVQWTQGQACDPTVCHMAGPDGVCHELSGSCPEHEVAS